MKFKFDANQDFQIEAIKSIVDIFDGQHKNIEGGGFHSIDLLGIYPNLLDLPSEEILTIDLLLMTLEGVR